MSESQGLYVGRIIVWYPAPLYSPILVPTAIQQFPSPISTPNIPFSKSIPNSDTIMPSNRAGFYDHNGTTFNSVPILEAEIQKLPVLCLRISSQQPLRVRTRIMGRSKGLIEEIQTQLRSWELVQGKRRYLSFKLDVLSW